MQEDSKILTILLPFNVLGDNGNIFYFNPFRQYCYEREGYLISGDLKYYYEVTIDSENYLLPKDKIAPCSKKRTADEQLSPAEKIKKDLYDNTEKDHKKRTLEVLGIDIKADERADFNGRWLAEFLINSQKEDNE